MVEAAKGNSKPKKKSPSDLVEAALKDKEYIGGAYPIKRDGAKFRDFNGEQPNEQTHPKAYAWYQKMAKFSPEELKNLPISAGQSTKVSAAK